MQHDPICDSRSDDLDVKFCVELGASIMLDKPILAVVRPGVKCSKKLMTVVDEIIEGDPTTTTGRKAISEAIERWVKEAQ